MTWLQLAAAAPQSFTAVSTVPEQQYQALLAEIHRAMAEGASFQTFRTRVAALQLRVLGPALIGGRQ
ncbi:hypothetical protein HNR60_001501 [Rhodopseudomonas rhenobacensis]|uniref:Uncharacterized protein n=1 Tax=Rhodopseudomonas rhenobacensis TaxID=87461 RepID=A0A7W7Z2M9_9BRAD|nr:hypothetical protein [Rhodopseudomonas rhenobacensis]MBB5046753.1 hypothetical protein [Rhodopseudomonas rhenobacensis]